MTHPNVQRSSLQGVLPHALPAEAPSMPGARAAVTAPLDGLLAGLRLALGTGEPDADVHALSHVADWNAVAGLARRHGVSSLLLQGLRTRSGLLTASGINVALQGLRNRAVRRGWRQLGGLKQATDCLAAHDVPCLVLKGLPLSQRLYGHPLVKESVDIDLLVSPRMVQTAKCVLLERGWRRIMPAFPDTPTHNRWYDRFVAEHALTGPGGRMELHSRPLHNPHYFDAPFESLYTNGAWVEIGSVPFRTLGWDDEFLYLACHGAKHYWMKLKWLCDVAAILAAMEPARLERMAARCREARLDLIFASTLLLCREAFHCEIPRDVLPSDGKRAAFMARVSRRSWDEEAVFRLKNIVHWVREKMGSLILKPDLRSVLHEVASVWVGHLDWARLNLPDKLFFLYFPLRPFLWLTRKAERRGAAGRREETRSASPSQEPTKTLHAFVRAPVAIKSMALEAGLFLLLARLLVKHVPMRHWRHRLDAAEEPATVGGQPERTPASKPGEARSRRPTAPPVVRRVTYIVRRVARRVPFPAVCLPRAMAAQWMLRRRGIPSRLFFGVRRDPDSALQFHAWLTVGGECVMGGAAVETYSSLPPFNRVGSKPG